MSVLSSGGVSRETRRGEGENGERHQTSERSWQHSGGGVDGNDAETLCESLVTARGSTRKGGREGGRGLQMSVARVETATHLPLMTAVS